MADTDTLTANCTLVCASVETYNEKLGRIQNYTPGQGEPSLSDVQEDAQSLTITYTLTASE